MKQSERPPGGNEKLAEELGTLEVFKPSKVAGKLHRFLQGVQKAFENSLSLERKNCTKCARESRTCQSPEDR
jgi:hypothetical protein